MTSVFLSHTSEFENFPNQISFVDAAIAAVNRVGAVPHDMRYFSARDQKPADYCQQQVQKCEIFVGIIGYRYGLPVRDRPSVSYTELEFETASKDPNKPRLMFLLDEDAAVPYSMFRPRNHGDRQALFRQRLCDSGLTVFWFCDPSGLELALYQALAEVLAPELRGTEQTQLNWPADRSPYPGLMRFTNEYAQLYFGRDRQVDELIAKMRSPGGRFVLVNGASGSGKSSLVGAGVWYALASESRIPGSNGWVWLRIRPTMANSPFQALAYALHQVFPDIRQSPDKLATALRDHEEMLAEILACHLQGPELLLFVDQMEELFTENFDRAEVQRFVELLISNTESAFGRLRVLATLRTEFLVNLDFPLVLDMLNAGCNYSLGQVGPAALREIIEKPAHVVGYKFERGLVEKIVDDAGHEPGSLPLVAYALNRLFAQRSGRSFTWQAYTSFGGIAGAIGNQADDVVARLDPSTTVAFDRILSELVHLNRDRPPTRRQVEMSTFDDNASAQMLIAALADANCRVLVTDERNQMPTVEVAHEKLFTAWPRLAKWIDRGFNDLMLIEYAREAATQWVARGQRAEDLWAKDRAVEIVDALARFGITADGSLSQFLNPQRALIAQLDANTMGHRERASIGVILDRLGDPRPGTGLREDGLPDIRWSEPIWLKRPETRAQHAVVMKAFRLAIYPVTNVQYQSFSGAPDYESPEWWVGLHKPIPRSPCWEHGNHPRETVSWHEALAFCRWLTNKFQHAELLRQENVLRLPTESEWLFGATAGNERLEFPWGNWDGTHCNSIKSGLQRTTAVGIYPSGASHHGLLDMAGNVWEWCLNRYEDPEDPTSTDIDEQHLRGLRGGSWFEGPEFLRCSARLWNDPAYRVNYVGFRLARSEK